MTTRNVAPQVYERTVYKIHHALTNNIRFLPGNDDLCCSASSDGFLKVFDLEIGESSAQVIDGEEAKAKRKEQRK